MAFNWIRQDLLTTYFHTAGDVIVQTSTSNILSAGAGVSAQHTGEIDLRFYGGVFAQNDGFDLGTTADAGSTTRLSLTIGATGTVSAEGSAIEISRSGAAITNHGTLDSRESAVFHDGDQTEGTHFVNYGTVTSTEDSAFSASNSANAPDVVHIIDNLGDLSGGISIFNTSLEVNNAGQIAGDITASVDSAIENTAANSGTLTLNNSGTILDDIAAYLGNVEITNSEGSTIFGRISTGLGRGLSVQLDIVNHGVIGDDIVTDGSSISLYNTGQVGRILGFANGQNSIDNFGTISTLFTEGDTTLINYAGGTISGQANLFGGASVFNEGLIGGGLFGLTSDTNMVNAEGGTITGRTSGVEFAARFLNADSVGTLFNAGTIIGLSASNDHDFDGDEEDAAGLLSYFDNAVITNAATGVIRGEGFGVYQAVEDDEVIVTTASLDFNNAGQIQALTQAGLFVRAADTTLVNSGEILGFTHGLDFAGNTLRFTNSGTFDGGEDGVRLDMAESSATPLTTLTNTGMIQGRAGDGLVAAGASFVLINGADASILGGNQAVVLEGDVGDADTSFVLDNDGVIHAAQGGGVVADGFNTYDIRNSGELSAGGQAIEAFGNGQADSAFTLQNTGTITATNGGGVSVIFAAASLFNADGAVIRSSGTALDFTRLEVSDALVFTNAGLIDSTTGRGLSATGYGSADILNTGTLAAQGSALRLDGTDDAVLATYSVSNRGVLETRGTDGAVWVDSESLDLSNAAGATIRSGGIAVQLLDSTAQDNSLYLSNLGTIEGGADAASAIASGAGDDAVLNGRSGVIIGSVFLGNGSDVLRNAGEISGITTMGYGDDLVRNGVDGRMGAVVMSFGMDTLSNAGTITDGVSTGGFAFGFPAFTYDDAADAITNTATGQISGTVSMGGGNDVFVSAGAVFGDISMGRGTHVDADALTLLAGSVTVGDIDTGGGADVLVLAGTQRGDVATGEGDDLFRQSGISAGTVDLGAGADVLSNGLLGQMSGPVVMGDGADTLTNFGLIDGDIVMGTDAAQSTLVNRGTLIGDVTFGSGGDTMKTTGEVVGDLDFGGGADRLVVGGGQINGNLLLGTGNDTVINRADMISSIDLGDGADLYDGRGGSLEGIVIGGSGNDTLIAGDTGLRMDGGAGRDALLGGAGADTFIYSDVGDSVAAGGAFDRVRQFTVDEDQFDLRDVTQGVGVFVGSNAFAGSGTASVRATQSGVNTLIQVDVDGDGVEDMRMLMNAFDASLLDAGDFLL